MVHSKVTMKANVRLLLKKKIGGGGGEEKEDFYCKLFKVNKTIDKNTNNCYIQHT